jgi:hypothetical protein
LEHFSDHFGHQKRSKIEQKAPQKKSKKKEEKKPFWTPRAYYLWRNPFRSGPLPPQTPPSVACRHNGTESRRTLFRNLLLTTYYLLLTTYYLLLTT